MATKEQERNRRVRAARKIADIPHTAVNTQNKRDALQKQYRLIRQDVQKLRSDLAHGYELLRELVETKMSRRTLIREK